MRKDRIEKMSTERIEAAKNRMKAKGIEITERPKHSKRVQDSLDRLKEKAKQEEKAIGRYKDETGIKEVHENSLGEMTVRDAEPKDSNILGTYVDPKTGEVSTVMAFDKEVQEEKTHQPFKSGTNSEKIGQIVECAGYKGITMKEIIEKAEEIGLKSSNIPGRVRTIVGNCVGKGRKVKDIHFGLIEKRNGRYYWDGPITMITWDDILPKKAEVKVEKAKMTPVFSEIPKGAAVGSRSVILRGLNELVPFSGIKTFTSELIFEKKARAYCKDVFGIAKYKFDIALAAAKAKKAGKEIIRISPEALVNALIEKGFFIAM